MQESSCHEQDWRCEVNTVDEEEGVAFLKRCHLARVSQVGIPSEHERACKDDVEASESLDAIKHGKMLNHLRIHFRRVHRLAHLIRLQVHLVDVTDCGEGHEPLGPRQLLLHDNGLILVSALEAIELLQDIIVELGVIANAREFDAGANQDHKEADSEDGPADDFSSVKMACRVVLVLHRRRVFDSRVLPVRLASVTD